MFCQVTCLNAYDACKEWLSIWVDRGVSWVLDDCILRPQEAARLRMCWQGRRGSPRYGGKQRWCITVPRGRCLWFTPVSSICRRQRVDLRCMHQVTGGQIPLVHKRTLLNLGVLILETVAIILSKKRYLYWIVGIKGKKRWLNFNESLNHGTCMSFALSAVCLYYLWFLSNSANQLLNLSTAQAYSIPIGVRAGGTGGAAAPPKFWAIQIFWAAREIWAKPVFKDVFKFFIEIDRYFLFLPEFKNGKPVKFTRESGCLARDELLVISKGGL